MWITIKNKEHLIERCSRLDVDVARFVAAVARADQKYGSTLTEGEWAIKVNQGSTTVGYAVGSGRVWTTILSSGQQVRPNSKIQTVSI